MEKGDKWGENPYPWMHQRIASLFKKEATMTFLFFKRQEKAPCQICRGIKDETYEYLTAKEKLCP